MKRARQNGPELALDHAAVAEPTLRAAHAAAGLETPFEQVMQIPVLRRCFQNVVLARRRKDRACT